MAISVSLLWGCLISERLIVHRANLERGRVLHNIRRLRWQHEAQPASSPLPRVPVRLRVAAG